MYDSFQKLFNSLLLIFTFCVCLSSCNKKDKRVVTKGFYYWKSNYSLSQTEDSVLKYVQPKKLYIKFFDVVKDPVFQNIPISKTRLRINTRFERDSTLKKTYNQLEIIPVVFIKNEVLIELEKKEIDSLADNINYLINKYYKKLFQSSFGFNREIQIDCDWTTSTSNNYFYLLKKIQKLSSREISCTLRLYPYKFKEKLGVPPVDRVMLMCYNFKDPIKNKDENTIQNITELKKYLFPKNKYPLPLDIALPIFSWIQVYQNGQLEKLLNGNKYKVEEFSKAESDLWSVVNRDTVIDDIYLRVGDRLKHEKISKEKTDKTIALLQQHVFLQDTLNIALFHLDEQVLNTHSYEDLNSIYTDFSLGIK